MMIDRSVTRRPVHPVLWAMAGLMIGLEVLFAAVEAGLAPAVLSRGHAYAVFAFYDLLFEAALAGHVTLQFFWSLLSHALLHGGFMHLALNTAVFLGLGHAISAMAGMT